MKDIFVGNLDYGTSEDELRQLFAAYGPVDRVSIVTDRYQSLCSCQNAISGS